MRDIGKNINQLRTDRGMTQDELAEQLFVTRQTISNYEMGKSRPDIDMLERIGRVLGTDIQTILYGPQAKERSPEVGRLIVCGILTGVFAALWTVLLPIAEEIKLQQYLVSPEFAIYFVIKPLCFLFAGWTLALLVGMALKIGPLKGKYVRGIGVILLVLMLLWFGLSILYTGLYGLDEWLYINHLRGEWEETWIEADGEPYLSRGWVRIPLPMVDWLGRIPHYVYITLYRIHVPYHMVFLIPGAALWLCGIPGHRKKAE